MKFGLERVRSFSKLDDKLSPRQFAVRTITQKKLIMGTELFQQYHDYSKSKDNKSVATSLQELTLFAKLITAEQQKYINMQKRLLWHMQIKALLPNYKLVNMSQSPQQKQQQEYKIKQECPSCIQLKNDLELLQKQKESMLEQIEQMKRSGQIYQDYYFWHQDNYKFGQKSIQELSQTDAKQLKIEFQKLQIVEKCLRNDFVKLSKQKNQLQKTVQHFSQKVIRYKQSTSQLIFQNPKRSNSMIFLPQQGWSPSSFQPNKGQKQDAITNYLKEKINSLKMELVQSQQKVSLVQEKLSQSQQKVVTYEMKLNQSQNKVVSYEMKLGEYQNMIYQHVDTNSDLDSLKTEIHSLKQLKEILSNDINGLNISSTQHKKQNQIIQRQSHTIQELKSELRHYKEQLQFYSKLQSMNMQQHQELEEIIRISKNAVKSDSSLKINLDRIFQRICLEDEMVKKVVNEQSSYIQYHYEKRISLLIKSIDELSILTRHQLIRRCKLMSILKEQQDFIKSIQVVFHKELEYKNKQNSIIQLLKSRQQKRLQI